MSRFRFLWLLLSLCVASPVSATVLSVGHRGNCLFAPENTVASFKSALGKADVVEGDGHVTSDGKIVIMHDDTVTRTTDGTGSVSSKTLAQMKLLDAGSWFSPAFIGERVPTLEEMVTNVLPHANLCIEGKTGAASVYVDELRRLGALTNTVLESFDWNFLANAHALEPALPLCALGSGSLTAGTIASITNSGATIVGWEFSTITSNEVNLVHAAGLQIWVWSVDGAIIQNFIDMGVDGIFSNDPGMVKQLRDGNPPPPTDLNDNLSAYWKFDDGLTNAFATVVSDSRGPNTGSLVRGDGASHWLPAGAAMFGGALEVNGTNTYASLPRTTTLDINTNEVTISAWVWLPQLPSQIATTFGSLIDSSADSYVLYLDRSAKQLRCKVTSANGNSARPGIPEQYLRTNQWLHVCATFSGHAGPVTGQAAIYLNGEPQDVHTGDDSAAPNGLGGNIKSGQTAAVGRDGPSGASYLASCVDDVAVWRRTLSAADIRRLYNAGKVGQSLGDLLIQPTALMRIISIQPAVPVGQLQITFQNLGTWQNFELRRATNSSGPFYPVTGLAPVSQGNGIYRFTYPMNANAREFFRVEGRP